MTPYPFRLSNNQRKQYLIRRGLIRIAIPLPLDWEETAETGDDRFRTSDERLAYFVLQSLANDISDPSHLRAVEEAEIAVVPQESSLLGKIIGDIEAQSQPHIVVVVAIAAISVDASPRHNTAQLQWPGDCSLVWPSFKKQQDEPA